MLYSQEELPESISKSLLTYPHAQKIFARTYNRVWRQLEVMSEKTDEAKRNEAAFAAGWHAVKEAYGLSY